MKFSSYTRFLRFFLLIVIITSSALYISRYTRPSILPLENFVNINNKSTDASPFSIELNNHDNFMPPFKNKVSITGFDADSHGNYFVVGYYGSFDGTFLPIGPTESFLSKINPKGRILWTKTYSVSYPNDQFQTIHDVKIDSEDNIILAYQTFGNPFRTINATSYYYEYYPSDDLYIKKLDPQGKILWSFYFGGTGLDCCNQLAVDELDNIYVSGYSASFNFPVTYNVTGIYPAGANLFLTKITPTGVFDWATVIGGSGYDNLFNFEYIGNNKLLFSAMSNSLDFPRVNDTTTTVGRFDAINFRFDVNTKSIDWTNSLGGTSDETSVDIIEDLDGSYFMTSYTTSTDFNTTLSDNKFGGGIRDIGLTSFDASHNIVWSRYIGGNGSDLPISIEVVGQKIILVGVTDSRNFNSTDGTVLLPGENFFISIYDKSIGTLISTTILATSIDLIWGYNKQLDNNIYLGLNCAPDLKIEGKPVENLYPYDFNSTQLSYLFTLNTQSFIPTLITNLVMVPEPNRDYDQDGLTNWEEYNLYFDGVHVNPAHPDSDGDGLPDGWEVQFGLTPDNLNDSSANADSIDGDGLTNIQEYQFGTAPNATDTDNDGMTDFYEYQHGLQGNYDDSMEDFDGDGITNLYEALNELNASDYTDYAFDPDHDGLTNYDEFILGTQANASDTDGDGMKDGVEVQYGLDPMTPDATKDHDHDLLPNGFEVEHNLNPDSPIELILPLLLIFIAILSIIGWKYYSIKRNSGAKQEGYLSYQQKRDILKAGFTDINDYKSSIHLKYYSKKSVILSQNLGYSTFDKFQLGIESAVAEVYQKFQISVLSPLFDKISAVNTPLTLLDAKHEVQRLEIENKDVHERLLDFEKALSTIVEINDRLIKETKSIDLYIPIELLSLQSKVLESLILLNKINDMIDTSIQKKEVWLRPWPALLKLVNITKEKTPIPIEDIVEVTNVPREHAVELIKLLLAENPDIGEFDEETLMYYKSNDVAVMNYMRLAKEFLGTMEE